MAQNVKVRFYINGLAVTLGDSAIPFLDPPNGSNSTIPLNVIFPDAGPATLLAVIDPDNQNDEGSLGENNNLITRTLTIDVPLPDNVPPVIQGILLNQGVETTTKPQIQAVITATDPAPNASGVQSIHLIEYTYDVGAAQWVPVQQSGWLPQVLPPAFYPWQLQPSAGMHYLQARAIDASGNISVGNARAQISYIPPSDIVARGQTRVYRQEVQAGQQLEVTLESLSGDADLYLWSSRTDQSVLVSNQNGSASEHLLISSTQIVPVVYQIEVYGFSQAEYRLQVKVSDATLISAASQALTGITVPNKSEPGTPVVPVDSTPDKNSGTWPDPNPIPQNSQNVFLPLVSR